ncbi:M20 family metallopeptidase [Curtobacterium sp. MCBD17_035]|uniref:M20 family metallopeptidase n=1 Tax=Curtobacterium sp. MCBD17_035 TaxID=2175673 RepID=UPI001C6494A2|nr:M20 family metallopeptidase [Curtobacterium sp. MCBD17_035]WIB68135.1 M20 family metallopeptidase [Curtobacterium sp. MCBD17_035]
MTATGTTTDLLDWVAGHRDAMVGDVLAYVGIETPSDAPALLAEGLAWVEQWLGATVGAPTARTVHPTDGHGDVAVLDLEAPLGSDVWVTALCHYDTVWAAGTIAARPAAVDGDRMTGPGVYDMKAGLVQLAWAIRAVDAAALPRPNIRLLLNGDEEVGSKGSRTVIEDTVRRTDGPVLVFEASAGEHGALKTARNGVGLFDIEITGVEAHAGLDPRAGASAVDELARVVLTLHGATDLEAGTSCNVGVVAGGTRPNVRAGHASAALDVRVSSSEEADRIDGVLAALTPENPLATITVHGGWNRPVMERTEANVALFARAESVARGMGLTVEETAVGGASDGNFASALGRAVLDGLGAVGDGAHARHEWASVQGMVERTALAAGVLVDLASGTDVRR